MNISGNAASWLVDNQDALTKKEMEKTPERKKISIEKELKGLISLRAKLQEKYEENPEKNLFDSLTTIDMAIKSMKNVN